MLPSAYHTLQELPLTPSGKIDRNALPDPDPTQRDVQHEFVAPRNATEERIAKIWAGLLELDRVGVHDDFFQDLGAHSLVAARMMATVASLFGVSVPLQTLFLRPTVAALAAAVEEELERGLGAQGGDEERLRRLIEGLSEEEVESLLSDPLIAGAEA
jgi:acyl carrier protein